jgi:hypothetical protein
MSVDEELYFGALFVTYPSVLIVRLFLIVDIPLPKSTPVATEPDEMLTL